MVKSYSLGIVLLLTTILPGTVGVVIFGYYALIDWDALQAAYVNFSAAVQGSSTFETILAAEAQQNIHRVNLFADGVWTLLSAILAAIGWLGLYLGAAVSSQKRDRRSSYDH